LKVLPPHPNAGNWEAIWLDSKPAKPETSPDRDRFPVRIRRENPPQRDEINRRRAHFTRIMRQTKPFRNTDLAAGS
jgi:hypothetical protein